MSIRELSSFMCLWITRIFVWLVDPDPDQTLQNVEAAHPLDPLAS